MFTKGVNNSGADWSCLSIKTVTSNSLQDTPVEIDSSATHLEVLCSEQIYQCYPRFPGSSMVWMLWTTNVEQALPFWSRNHTQYFLLVSEIIIRPGLTACYESDVLLSYIIHASNQILFICTISRWLLESQTACCQTPDVTQLRWLYGGPELRMKA